MTRYLLSIQQPDGPPPADVDLGRVGERIEAILGDMRASGAWIFNGALHPPDTATVVQIRDGDQVLTDGPYAEGKEHVGGIAVIAVPDLDEALGWATRLAEAIGLPIEVRPFVAE